MVPYTSRRYFDSQREPANMPLQEDLPKERNQPNDVGLAITVGLSAAVIIGPYHLITCAAG
jgi:hypothetical protein